MRDPELERMKREHERFMRRIGAAKQQVQQETEALRVRRVEEAAHQPRQLGTVTDREAQRRMLRTTRDVGTVHNKTTINEWDDGYGNVVYLPPNINLTQVHAVSARITQQRTAFDALGPDQQVQVRAAFGLARPGASIARYQDFLQSEALGIRFQQLKAQPPAPR